MSLYYLFRIVI